MWYWSFDAIIDPFNEVILEGLASFGSWFGEDAPDYHREAVHSLLWFYTEAQGVIQAELRRCAVALQGNQQFWKAPRWRGRLPGCGLAAPDPCSACLPGPQPTLDVLWVPRRWPGALSCWCGLTGCHCCLGCSTEGLSPGWCHLNKVTGQRPLHSAYLYSSVLKGQNKSQICSLYFSLKAVLLNHQSQWI